MKISDLIEFLKKHQDANGDVEVCILDDDLGEFLPVHGGFMTVIPDRQINRLELLTLHQIELDDI